MPEYRLHYFNLRGRAEIIRLIFKVAGVEFEDIRYNRETEWPAVKDSMPFGQVPVLEIDGKKFAQSPAIARYLAEEFKLLGNDKKEALQADMISGSISDLIPHTRPVLTEKDEAKRKELAKQLFVDIIVPYLVRLEKIYKENGKEYLVSDKLTWGDLAFFAFFNLGVEHKSTEVIFGKTPALKTLYEKIANIPAIKTWVETRPASPM